MGSWTLSMLQCIMGASTASEVVMRVREAQICFLMLKLELQYVFHITYIYMYISSSLLGKVETVNEAKRGPGWRGMGFCSAGPSWFLMPRKATQMNECERGFLTKPKQISGPPDCSYQFEMKVFIMAAIYNSPVCVFLHLAWQLKNTP